MGDLVSRSVEPVPTSRSRPDEDEFLSHMNTVMQQRMRDDGFTNLEGRDFRFIIQPNLRKFMWVRAVDAMEWALMCAMGDMEFDQAKEEEIPLLCRYYNDYLTQDSWTDQEHTFMKVLNKFCEIKARGYGNFTQAAATTSIALDP